MLDIRAGDKVRFTKGNELFSWPKLGYNKTYRVSTVDTVSSKDSVEQWVRLQDLPGSFNASILEIVKPDFMRKDFQRSARHKLYLNMLKFIQRRLPVWTDSKRIVSYLSIETIIEMARLDSTLSHKNLFRLLKLAHRLKGQI